MPPWNLQPFVEGRCMLDLPRWRVLPWEHLHPPAVPRAVLLSRRQLCASAVPSGDARHRPIGAGWRGSVHAVPPWQVLHQRKHCWGLRSGTRVLPRSCNSKPCWDHAQWRLVPPWLLLPARIGCPNTLCKWDLFRQCRRLPSLRLWGLPAWIHVRGWLSGGFLLQAWFLLPWRLH